MIFVLTAILLANTKDDTLYFTVLSVLFLLVVLVSVIYYYKIDSINSIVIQENDLKRTIRRISNGKRELKSDTESAAIDKYVRTFKN